MRRGHQIRRLYRRIGTWQEGLACLQNNSRKEMSRANEGDDNAPIFHIQRRRRSRSTPRTTAPIIILASRIQRRTTHRPVQPLHRPRLALHAEHPLRTLGALHAHAGRQAVHARGASLRNGHAPAVDLWRHGGAHHGTLVHVRCLGLGLRLGLG